MIEFKAKLARFKANIISIFRQKKFNKKTKNKADLVQNFFELSSFFIIFYTSYCLNWYFGMYILALELLIFSYFISKK